MLSLIYIAVISPVGVDKKAIVLSVRQFFGEHGYDFKHIKLSDLIKRYGKEVYDEVVVELSQKMDRESEYFRRKTLIEAGNRLRKKYTEPSLLAMMAVREMCNSESSGHVYLIDSIKNKSYLS